MNEPNQREEAIFDAALSLAPEQRPAYLNKACSDDPGLRQRLEVLLKAHDQAAGFLEKPAAPLSRTTVVLSVPLTEKAGDRIGRYKLLQQIGEGGCGVVYMAEQEEPVRRRVALKVIKLGMDTKSVMARFEAERQALALMDHPNIARVLDAGATETGRPFFVMELVRGIKIIEYCDQNKLSTEERLKLFIQVCHAIQHAHTKGIIHRDIKPSNILVTLHDGVPVPKVIDFGIAKATQGRLTDQTLFTAFEQFIGTPAYMSPEQAEMSGLDIDTRSDVYALGVLLYELLTGKTPFDSKELLAAGLDRMRLTIREKEPERPSSRLSTMLASDLTATANCRHIDVPKLLHLIRGDLDWIVMKCLEKDRTRRFETASALAMDVQRFLKSEPVEARPPSNLYRFQKLVRRNKTVFAAIGAVAAALVLGLCVSIYLYFKENEAYRRAVAAEKQQALLREQAEAGLALERKMRLMASVGEKMTTAGYLISQGQSDKAEELMKEVPPMPQSFIIYNALGLIHACRGEWRAALTNYTRSTEIDPTNHLAYQYIPPLLVQTGDLEAFRQYRERILRQFAGTADPVVAERMARVCLILPAPATDLESIGKMVDTALAAGPNNNQSWDYLHFLKGLAEYRLGHFAGAVDWLQKVVAQEEDPYRTVQAYMLLAMAQQQLKQVDHARATLVKGIDLAEARVPRLDGPVWRTTWNDQMTVHLLIREARALIEGESKASGEAE